MAVLENLLAEATDILLDIRYRIPAWVRRFTRIDARFDKLETTLKDIEKEIRSSRQRMNGSGQEDVTDPDVQIQES